MFLHIDELKWPNKTHHKYETKGNKRKKILEKKKKEKKKKKRIKVDYYRCEARSKHTVGRK